MKRFLALLMSVCLIITALPIMASADFVADIEKNTLIPDGTPESVPSDDEIIGVSNLLQNGDFENDTNNIGPWNWTGFGGAWGPNQMVVYETNFGHESSRSVKLTNGDPLVRPWVMQAIEIDAEAEYQFGMWIYTNFTAEQSDGDKRGKGNTALLIEFYSGVPGSDTTNGSIDLIAPSGTGGKWVHFTQRLEIPAGTKYARVYARRYGVGTVWVDDMTVYNTVRPNPITVTPDQTFYYSDQTTPAYAEAEVNLKAYPELEGTKLDMALTLNGKVIEEQKDIQTDENGIAKWYFDVSWMNLKNTEYRIEATVDEYTNFDYVYKYDRPTYLGKDGVFRKNGVELMPSYAWWYMENHYKAGAKEGKITIAEVGIPRTGSDRSKIASIKKTLDTLQKKGMYALILTYSEMKGGGHPDLRHDTELICAAIKDHPAVFAYVNNDEPFARNANAGDELRETYIAIRNNDPNHPVMSMEQGSYNKAVRYVDIFGIDPYPADLRDPLTFVAQKVNEAFKILDGRKPVYTLLQALDYRGYWPSNDEMRSMIYQSFLSGGGGVGYFRFYQAQGKIDLHQTDLWPAISGWAQNEFEDTYNAFVLDKYPIFSDVKEDDYWAVSYVKENKIQMVVLNRKKEDQEIEIPLTSLNGTNQITAFTGKLLYGAEEATVSGNEVLKITLPGSAALLYEIVPKNAAEISGVEVMRFRDLTKYGWAYDSILRMDKAGVLDSNAYHYYHPERNITRGDFAMFLVRALGLKADNATCTFTDVLPNVTYAKEVAIGQTLGILKGSGDGTFRPEEPISRQDFMVICARGMRLVSENGLSGGDLSAFSDAALVADYAAEDIMAMVNAGIVKGNADGTINPLGNATRAEAAVIMDRITAWKAQ